MKRIVVILLALVTAVVVLSSCSGKQQEAAAPAAAASADAPATAALPTVINATEYTLYQNIFYNDLATDYVDQQVSKEGVFAVLYDAYNEVTRYYVWGYYDETKCCDWQWEIKPEDTAQLPSPGSLVTVDGTFVADDNALDKYWIINPQITVKTAYQGPDCDVDITAMNGTLLRVEFQNILARKEVFEGKTIAAYGRVNGEASIQHPYYDNACEITVSGEEALPDFGTMVTVQGVIADGAITEATAEATDQY